MTNTLVEETLPEWEPFAAAARARHPDAGTWCEAWTVRDVVVHQTGNAEELSRVLQGHLAGEPVATRSFDEREAPYRALDDADLWAALDRHLVQLSEVSHTATRDLGPDTDVAWTGRTMKVRWFAEHMREELVIHRWDITGDDATAQAAMAQPWLTTHTVAAVGRPLLNRGASTLELDDSDRVEGRIRVGGGDDVVVSATRDTTSMAFSPPHGQATIETDAATRCLFLWGRRPSDPSRWRSRASREDLGRFRALLAGY